MNSKKKEGKLFYKYQPINEHLFENLIHNQLYFRDPRDYNDPLDSIVDGYYEGTSYEWIKSQRVNNVSDIEFGIKIGLLKRDGNLIRQSIQQRGERIENSYMYLACCFCEKADNILMWSHYANDHKGVCLSFKSRYKPKSPEYEYLLTVNSEDAPLYKTKYQKATPTKINFLNEDRKRVSEFFQTKSSKWEYEKEYRVVLPEPDTPNKNNFKKEELEGVIFGLNRTHKGAYRDVYKVCEIIKENYLSEGINVNFYRTERIVGKYKGTYKLRIVKINGIDNYLRSVRECELNTHLQMWKPRNTTIFIYNNYLDKYIQPADRELFEHLQTWIPLNPRQMQ